MYEEREYGIQVPSTEQEAFLTASSAGEDPMTEEGLHDIRSIGEKLSKVRDTVSDIGEQRVPEKYVIIRMCRAARLELEELRVLLDETEKKHT